MTNPSLKLAVIVLNWNDFDETCTCVESVLKSDYAQYEIFLVDNNSSDGSSVKLRDKFPQVTFIQNKENLGFTGGNNIAIKKALYKGFDYFWLLNNDTVIENNCISALMDAAQQDTTVGLLTPLVYNFPQKSVLQHVGCYLNSDKVSIKNIPDVAEYLNVQDKYPVCLWGTALFIKKFVIDAVGLLDDKYFAYDEDIDYSLRAIKAGYKCQVVVNTKVYHKNNIDLKGTKERKDHYFYYMARNDFRLFVSQVKGLGRIPVIQKQVSQTIEKAVYYKEMQCTEAMNATLDGLYDAISNRSGAWDRKHHCPKFLKNIIMSHPYFISDLVNFRFNIILSGIFKRIKHST